MVFMKPQHPPVPEGMYECPDCAWSMLGPGWRSVLAEVEAEGYEADGHPIGYEEIYVPCERCGGLAYVAERRSGERRQGKERRRT